jgi:nucleotide-binding universal stress UspA family protein
VNFQRVIVGIDGSVPSRAAIRWAAEEAEAAGAELVLAHVIDDEWGTVSERMVDEAGSGSAHLVDLARTQALEYKPELEVATLTMTGSPMWELAGLSDRATLLVVGTHKSGFHYGRAFGSRSLQLANLATGAVAVVPESAVRSRRGVVVGVDPTTSGRAALDLAAMEADRRGTELTMIRASTITRPGWFDHGILNDLDPRADETARNSLAAAVDRVKALCPHTTIRSRVVTRPAGVALNELARTAEILVIGDSRRPGAQPGMLGSVAYDVLLNLTSPTIVVHTTEAATENPDVVSDDPKTKGVNRATR